MAKPKTKAEPRHQRCAASLLVGIILAGIAMTAMVIDLRNNYSFGAAISFELGLVMALAAIGLTALPAAAALLGRWDMLLRTGTALAVLLTVLAAISAYSEKQGAQILARQAAAVAYEQALADGEAAREEIQRARAEAADIGEALTPGQLGLLVAEAAAKAEREAGRKGCGPQCELAKAEHVALIARLGRAEAKAEALIRAAIAQARLDQARLAAKAGPAEASMLATVIAGQTGYAPDDVARVIALGTTGFSIAVTLVMALLMHQATALILKGLGYAPHAAQQQPVEQPVVAPPSPPHPAFSPRHRKPVRPISEDRIVEEERLLLFAQECLRPGGETVGEDMGKAVTRWWAERYPTAPVPSMNVISRVLIDAGVRKAKRQGRVRYSATLAVPALH